MNYIALLTILVGVVFHSLALFTPGIDFVIDLTHDPCLFYSTLMTVAFCFAVLAVLAVAYQWYTRHTDESGRVNRRLSTNYCQPIMQISLVLVIYLQLLAIEQSRTLTTCQSVDFEARNFVFAAGLITTIGTTLLLCYKSTEAHAYITM